MILGMKQLQYEERLGIRSMANGRKAEQSRSATIRYDTIEELNVDSKAEYTA